jgi:hypothetical protein
LQKIEFRPLLSAKRLLSTETFRRLFRAEAPLDQAAYSLNPRPRQTLGGMTPSGKLAEAMQ